MSDDNTTNDGNFDMDALLNELQEESPEAPVETVPAKAAATAAPAAKPVVAESAESVDMAESAGGMGSFLDDDAINALLQEASFADSDSPMASAAAATASSMRLPDFQRVVADADAGSIDLLRDVNLNVKIELGRSRMSVENVLKLVDGSVVELDKLAGDPVDVFINDRLVARGEVLVLNDNFCVRVNEILQNTAIDAA